MGYRIMSILHMTLKELYTLLGEGPCKWGML